MYNFPSISFSAVLTTLPTQHSTTKKKQLTNKVNSTGWLLMVLSIGTFLWFKKSKKRSLFWRFFSIHFTFCVHSAVFLDRTPAHWLYNFALRLKWPSRSPVLQDGRHWGRGSGQARRSGLWRFPGARLQARCQRALWRGRPGDHIQKPQVSYTATLVGHTGHWLWIAHNSALRTHSSILPILL